MKQSNTEEFSEKLYGAIHQSAQNAVVPSFDRVMDRIKRDESVESFEQFFADDGEITKASKSRRFWGRTIGAAAAVVLLIVSGVLVNGLVNSRSSFSTDAEKSVYYESSAQAAYALDLVENAETKEGLEEGAEVTDETLKIAEDTATLYYDDCAEAIISGGRKLMISLDELTDGEAAAR